jgi:hypothetical protein
VQDVAPRYLTPAKPSGVIVVIDLEYMSANVLTTPGHEFFDVYAIDRCAAVETPVIAYWRHTIKVTEINLAQTREQATLQNGAAYVSEVVFEFALGDQSASIPTSLASFRNFLLPSRSLT